jgi:antitoxin HigA-1
MKKLAPLHPGEVLREEFMKPLGLTAYSLGKACHVPRDRLEKIADEKKGIGADTALRLAKYFGVEPQFWMNLQDDYELERARAQIGPILEEIETRAA